MQMEGKKVKDPGIFRAKKNRCMWRSPFAPLLNSLNHELAVEETSQGKDSTQYITKKSSPSIS